MFPLQRKFKRVLDRKADVFAPLPGQLGNGLGTVATGVDGMVYVRVGQAVEVALCSATPKINNLLVWVGITAENPGVLQVLGQRLAAATITSERVAAVQAHANTHEYMGAGAGGGTDVVHVQLGQFMPLRVFAYSGMIVGVYPGIVQTGSGRVLVASLNLYGKPVPTLIDLTAYRPLTGGNARYALISVSSAGALTVTAGDETTLADLELEDIPASPAGTLFELAAVRLSAGQLTVAENRETTDLVDLRFPMHHYHAAGELIDASLDSLNDVSVTDPAAGELMYYDGAEWVNADLATAGAAAAGDLADHISDTDNPHGVTKSQVGLGYVANTLYNLAGDRAPDADDDSGDGYSVGSHWLDVSGGVLYICLDDTAGAAVWQEIGSGGGASAAYIVDTDGAYILDAEGRYLIEPASGSSDAHAIHDNQANEISEIVEKTTLAAGDVFLVESLADGYAKRSVKAENILLPDTYGRVLIADVTLSADGAFSVSGIPSDFDHLEYDLVVKPSATTTRDVLIALNGDTTSANYLSVQHYGGDAHNVQVQTSYRGAGWIPYYATAGAWAVIHGRISFAQMAIHKIVETNTAVRSGAALGLMVNRITHWSNTAAVTQIDLTASADQLKAGSRLMLYGLRGL